MERLNFSTSTTDIYIRKMGNDLAGVIFKTKDAVRVAKESNVPNHYKGEEYHRIDIDKRHATKILTWAITHKLSVDSEIPMMIENK